MKPAPRRPPRVVLSGGLAENSLIAAAATDRFLAGHPDPDLP